MVQLPRELPQLLQIVVADFTFLLLEDWITLCFTANPLDAAFQVGMEVDRLVIELTVDWVRVEAASDLVGGLRVLGHDEE